MAVDAQSGKQCDTVDCPFSLSVGTGNFHVLFEVAVVACHDVVEGVVLVFESAGECGWSEKQTAEASCVGCTSHIGEVFGLSVCVGVLLGSVVAVAVYVLQRREERYLVSPFFPCNVVGKSSTVYYMACLFRYVGKMRLKVKLVASAAEFVGGVVFQTYACELCRAVKAV